MKNILTEAGIYFKEGEPLSRHTSFRIGGPVDIFAEPASAEQLAFIIAAVKVRRLPFCVIGNGSNLLAPDDGFRGMVICLGERFSDITVDGENLTASAGALLSRIGSAALKEGLGGFEFAHGIPGSLGGGVYMNAGAYGGELKDVITSVTFLDEDLKPKSLPGDKCEFGYRKSIFKRRKDWIITGAEIALKKKNRDDIEALMSELASKRREKQPLEYPSAGSTFKRPEGHFAAKLIEDCGLKGFKVGGAMVSEKHAGFVINTGGATCNDVLRLMEEVASTVLAKTGVILEPEVELLKEYKY